MDKYTALVWITFIISIALWADRCIQGDFNSYNKCIEICTAAKTECKCTR